MRERLRGSSVPLFIVGPRFRQMKTRAGETNSCPIIDVPPVVLTERTARLDLAVTPFAPLASQVR